MRYNFRKKQYLSNQTSMNYSWQCIHRVGTKKWPTWIFTTGEKISQILANISYQPYVYIIISSFLTLLSDTENEQLRWIPDESPGRLPVVVSTSKFRKILKCFWINIVWTLTQKRKSINANWEKLSLKRCKCSECSM